MLNALLLVVFHNVFHWMAIGANLLGAAVAIFSNYNLNNLWTFRHQQISGIGQYVTKLLHFYATSAFGVIVIQTGTIWLGVHVFGESEYFAFFILGTAFLLVWNYFMYSKVIWRKK